MFANWLLIYGQNLVIPTIVVLCELFFCWFFIFAFLFKAALGLCCLVNISTFVSLLLNPRTH